MPFRFDEHCHQQLKNPQYTPCRKQTFLPCYYNPWGTCKTRQYDICCPHASFSLGLKSGWLLSQPILAAVIAMAQLSAQGALAFGVTPCSRCLPGDSGHCHNNTLPRGIPVCGQPSLAGVLSSTHVPSPGAVSLYHLPTLPLPPLVVHLPFIAIPLHYLQVPCDHVLKGACDHWALTLSTCLRSVECKPNDTSQWSHLFMLAKCVPAAGHRLRWCEALKLVKSRLQCWADGDLSSFRSEALKDGRSLARRQLHSSSSISTSNFRRAKLAA